MRVAQVGEVLVFCRWLTVSVTVGRMFAAVAIPTRVEEFTGIEGAPCWVDSSMTNNVVGVWISGLLLRFRLGGRVAAC